MSEAASPDGDRIDGASGSSAGPRRQRRLTGVPLLVAVLAVVLFVQALFVLSYVGALHDPKPHGVAFGLVGVSPLPGAVGKQFSLKTTGYPSESAALRAIDRRKIDGAFVVGPDGARLIVVPGASSAGATALSTAFAAAAAAFHQQLEIVQVHPLLPGDAGGNVSFIVVMALIVGGYLASTMAMAFGGRGTWRRRLASLGIAAVVGGLLTDTLAGPVLDAVPTSKFLALWGLFTLVMVAVAFSAAALQAALGAAGTLVVVVVFVIFGAPASGGTVPNAFLPTLWRTFGPYLPAGAGTTAVRNTIYFDGNGITRSMVILSAYLVVGAVAVFAIHGRRTDVADVEAETAAASAAAVV